MRRFGLVCASFLVLAAAEAPRWILKPEAAQAIKSAFDRMSPVLRYESIQIDRDHVQVRLCEGKAPCFDVRLDPPEGACAGHVAGSFCVIFPQGAPDSAVSQTIDQALQSNTGSDLWSEVPRPVPQTAPAPARAVDRGTPAWQVRPFATAPHLITFALLILLVVASRRPAWRELALASAVALGAALWLDQVNPDAWAGDDESAGLLLAQDCVKLSVCHLASIDSGVQGFTNGAVWLHLLELVGFLGGATVAVRLVVIGLMAAGIGVLFLCVRRWLRPAFALPAALFALYGLSSGNDLSASNLVDASAVFFPAALSACALLVFVRTQKRAALVFAALLLSNAVNTHVAAASLLPALLMSAVLAGAQPVISALIATGAYLGMTLITSRFALADSWSHLPENTRWLAFGGWVIVIAVGAVLQPWFLRSGPRLRATLLGVMLLLPYATGMLWLHLQHRPPTGRYLPAILAPLAVLLAAGLVSVLEQVSSPLRLAWLGRWLPALAGVALLLRAPAPETAAAWTFEDGRRVAAHLESKGMCQAEQFARVQGPQCTSYAYASIPYACHGAEKDNANRQLRLWVTNQSQLPEASPRVEVLPGLGDHLILLSEIDGWLDKQHAQLCFVTPGQGQAERACFDPEVPDSEPFLYSRRLALGFGNSRHEAPYTMSFSFPVHPGAGQTHQFFFSENPRSFGPDPGHNDDGLAKCGWQVTAADGLESDRPLPANPVKLTSRDGSPGRVVVERVVGGDCGAGFPGRQIPCHLETTADDPAGMQPPPVAQVSTKSRFLP